MSKNKQFSVALLLLAFVSCTSIAPLGSVAAGEAAAASRYDLGQPYLGGALPGAEILVPKEPKDGSPTAQNDAADSAGYLKQQGSDRWMLAARDADLSLGWFTRSFSCAAGRTISDADTPKLAQLLRRAGTDFGMSTSGVKALYQRPRPFMQNGAPSCTPHDEADLRGNGSYPSGHSAIGYGTSLLLASILPGRAAQLVSRGRAYGESRAICNVHWTSDVEEGRVIASATFARLMSDDAFRSDLAAARAEMVELASVAPDPLSCSAEAAALASAE